MKRLRGSDAFAIYSETPTSPFVTLKVGIYRPTNSDDVPGIDEVKQFVLSGVARHIAYFLRRIISFTPGCRRPVTRHGCVT